MTHRTGPAHRRWWYILLLCLEWLIAFWLMLEFLEAGRAFIAERAYKDYSYAQNLKVYRMVPAEELDVPENKYVPPSSDITYGVPPPAVITGNTAASVDDRLGMVMRGEMRAVLDTEGRLLESWGEPLIEQDLKRYLNGGPSHGNWSTLFQAIRDGRETLKYRCTLTFTTPVHYAITLSKAGEGRYEVLARDINNTMPLEALHFSDVPGPESPWEIMFYRYKKNWSQPDNSMLQTNNFGFRDHPIVLPKPEGCFRIVCIGGSTTEEGNSTDSTYPKIVQRKLAERFGEGRVEVINAGTCGTNTYNIRRRFSDFLALDPNLILFYGGVNDTTHVHFQFWLNALPKWKKWALRSFVLRGYFGFTFMPDASYLSTYMEDTTYRNLLAMRHEALKHGVEMAWCSFAYPTLRWHDIRARNYYDVNMRDVWDGQGIINFRTYCRITDLFNNTGKAIAAREGIPWFPVAESFHAGPDHFFDICHMTPMGLELKTNIISGLISTFLEERGVVLLPEG
ncbi:MAG: SGNH/GDSL hydrolase family protein [Candidatus Hydrogenedentes bacterium]|nr:SGNH/GDSL hydrolase family protein [Candidatus Hydrogenedentota bacterium]